jgi:hypothetical protein
MATDLMPHGRLHVPHDSRTTMLTVAAVLVAVALVAFVFITLMHAGTAY